MEDANSVKRNSSFELLRIIAMLMIVFHHFVVHGLLNNSISPVDLTNGSNVNRFFVWLFFPGGEVGVALFFMITGYFCILSDKIKIQKVVFQVFFYAWFSLILYFSFRFFYNDYTVLLPWEQAKKSIIGYFLFPLRSSSFWFATAYILLRLFQPVLNCFLNKLNKKGYILFLCLMFMALLQSQMFIIVLGYTKALFFYSLGGFIRKYIKISEKYKVGGRGWYLLCFCVLWLLYAIIKFSIQNMNFKGLMKVFISLFNTLFPSCIIVTACSCSIFLFFMKNSLNASKKLNTVAATTFGIYLIHDSVFLRPLLWCKIVKVHDLYLQQLFPLYAITWCFGIFVLCSLIDLFRLKFIEPCVLKITNRISALIKEKLYI